MGAGEGVWCVCVWGEGCGGGDMRYRYSLFHVFASWCGMFGIVLAESEQDRGR